MINDCKAWKDNLVNDGVVNIIEYHEHEIRKATEVYDRAVELQDYQMMIKKLTVLERLFKGLRETMIVAQDQVINYTTREK